jgi:hypothetical protein
MLHYLDFLIVTSSNKAKVTKVDDILAYTSR